MDGALQASTSQSVRFFQSISLERWLNASGPRLGWNKPPGLLLRNFPTNLLCVRAHVKCFCSLNVHSVMVQNLRQTSEPASR